MSYATIGASLLADLTLMLIRNDSDTPFIASDTPVVLHNRLYEGQRVSVAGYANVGLQLVLPLGPGLALFGFDGAAYAVHADSDDIVTIDDGAQIRLINDLQWEAAHAVLLVPPDIPEMELRSSAANWEARRRTERMVYREEIVSLSDTEMRTLHGSGQAPSAVSLDLPFITCLLPAPPPLDPWEIPPFRDAKRAARVDRAFAQLDDWEMAQQSPY